MQSPPSGRVLAIGDIHGCNTALGRLLGAVSPGGEDLIITLGDYVDRGLDSAGVIDRIIQLREICRVICLLGNHEEMMMDARTSEEHQQLWLNCGGEAALMSYAPDADNPSLRDVPRSHWNFLERDCVDFFETESHIFVHGGVAPGLPVNAQPPTVLRWQTFPPAAPHKSGKIVVCGHTPQRSGEPANIGYAICIDTDVCRGGYLTCIDVNSGHMWQSDERGNVRADVLRAPMRRW
jgi:serine/threonine protein phosphatase 1